MKRKFLVYGLRPAYSKEANSFLKDCDLGIEGLFVHESLVMTATLNPDVTQDQLDRQPAAIKQALEENMGWVDVHCIPVHT